jgi:hypothetical protein
MDATIRPTTRPTAVRRLALVVVAALAITGFAGCGNDDTTSTPSTETSGSGPAPSQAAGGVDRFDDPTDTVAVAAGTTFEIALTADNANCYSWALTSDVDAAILNLESSEPVFLPGTTDPAFEGGSNQDLFTFEAVAAGTEVLTFTEQSPCPDSPPRETDEITVEVG